MTSHSASTRYILIGIIFIVIAISLQIHFKSATQLKPLDPKVAEALYNPKHNAIDGNPKGSITLVEFFDYNCKYCRVLHPKLKGLIAKNPQLRVIYKEFPLFGQTSLIPIAAALAAHNQDKYLLLQDALLTSTRPLNQIEILKLAQGLDIDTKQLKIDMDSAAVQAQIRENALLAKDLDIDGAPAIIIASNEIAQDPTQAKLPQYFYRGSNAKELQRLIDKIKIKQ